MLGNEYAYALHLNTANVKLNLEARGEHNGFCKFMMYHKSNLFFSTSHGASDGKKRIM